jgi:stearoyl-CoA desaturase (Delta-9 desaturase)
MLIIIGFFFLHWYLSAFAQSFFLHRYTAHKMFRMSPRWEKFFYLFTFISQGSSFLHPKAYAQLHLEHHKHSDTDEDPHSPHFFKDVFSMMWHTKRIYMEYRQGKRTAPTSFIANMPEWPLIDRIGDSIPMRLGFCAAYTAVYVIYAPSAWWFLLLPIHYLIGPFHGAFINWCGHKYGYRNYKTDDHSKNTFAWDFLFMGECFQNNHHQHPNRANFAVRWFEYDMVYPVIWLFNRIKIIDLKTKATS